MYLSLIQDCSLLGEKLKEGQHKTRKIKKF